MSIALIGVTRIDERQFLFIVVDMQNGFMEEGAPVEVPAARGVVDEINRLTGQVAQVNELIVREEANGLTASDLRDQRDHKQHHRDHEVGPGRRVRPDARHQQTIAATFRLIRSSIA